MYWKMQFCCFPLVWHLHAFLKPHRGVFVWTAQPQGGGKDFSSFTKEKWQMPDRSDRCAGDGHVWNWLSQYHLSLRPGGIITPGEDYHLSLPRGLLGLLHHCVEKSDLLSIFGLLHLLPLFLTNILVWSSSLLLAKEWWVGSIKSQVQSGCYSLFSNWLLC